MRTYCPSMTHPTLKCCPIMKMIGKPRTAHPTQVLKTATNHLMAPILNPIRIEVPVAILTQTANRALIPVQLRDLTPVRAATMVVTPSPVTMGVISRTCSRQRKSVPVPPRDPNHGCLLTAAADPGKQRTRNDDMFLPQKTIPIHVRA